MLGNAVALEKAMLFMVKIYLESGLIAKEEIKEILANVHERASRISIGNSRTECYISTDGKML
jgi:hypothetical protein